MSSAGKIAEPVRCAEQSARGARLNYIIWNGGTEMKKKLALILALALAFSLAGCGQVRAGLLAGVTPSESGDAADAAAAAAEFTAKLFTGVYDGTDTLISPVSLLAALAMAEAGARGETLAQMEAVFGTDAQTLRASLAAYMSSLKGTAAKTTNSVWFNDGGRFEPDADFLADCASFAGADIFAVPFGDGTLRELNAWVSARTDGMIPAAVSELPEDTVMCLVNALCFDSAWEDKYERSDVCDGVFHAPGGDRTVEMLHSEEHSYLSGEGFTGFMKPYEGGRYAFAALLPDEGSSLDALATSLSGDMLSAVLRALGMTDAFDPDSADFTGMGRSDTGRLYINTVMHSTYIELNAHGTRAAAVSIVGGGDGADAPMETRSVILDRPYLYMIVDTEYGLPLFIGTVTGAQL